MNRNIEKILGDFAQRAERITVLTGAGISAESNIPTFRGPEGFWTVGSEEYHPQEMATYRMFREAPDEVWKWYLYRMGICKKARPNPGHLALVEMERLFQNRFTLITQNVDNLHLRAGNRPEKTFQIHGNIFYMRCAEGCSSQVHPLPHTLEGKAKGEDLTERERELLRCPDCHGWARPHVLWFDETYNEEYYRYVSALKVAEETELLLIVGTSGATNLPNQIAWEVKRHDGIIIDINIEENPFTHLALTSNRGAFIKQASGAALSSILGMFRGGHPGG